jgi:hypothetical protein
VSGFPTFDYQYRGTLPPQRQSQRKPDQPSADNDYVC